MLTFVGSALQARRQSHQTAARRTNVRSPRHNVAAERAQATKRILHTQRRVVCAKANSVDKDGRLTVNAPATVLRLFAFCLYFAAASLLVRQLVYVRTAVYDKITGAALLAALPDLARFSFVELGAGRTPARAHLESNMSNHDLRSRAPQLATNALKLIGLFVASIARAPLGAALVLSSEIVFDLLVQFGRIDPAPYQMRSTRRGAVMILRAVALVAALLTLSRLAPLAGAVVFFSIEVGYWLSKYDIDLLVRE